MAGAGAWPVTPLDWFSPLGLTELLDGKQGGANPQDFYFFLSSEGLRSEGRATSSQDFEHDEEIFIHGNSVICSSGSNVRRRFSCPSRILNATWCSMKNSNDSYLALLHENAISFFSLSGTMEMLPLPFNASTFWKVPDGLFLKCVEPLSPQNKSFLASSKSKPKPLLANLLDSEQNKTPERFFQSSTSNSNATPNYFSSKNVWKNIQYSPNIFGSVEHKNVNGGRYFFLFHPQGDPMKAIFENSGEKDENIIWASSEFPIFVSYNYSSLLHSIWYMRKTSIEKDTDRGKISTATQFYIERKYDCVLHRMWKDSSPSAPSDLFLIAEDENENALLGILNSKAKLFSTFTLPLRISSSHKKSKLHFGDKKKYQTESSWSLSALSAAEIRKKLPNYFKSKDTIKRYFLILKPDEEISLHCGKEPIWKISSKAIATRLWNFQSPSIPFADMIKKDGEQSKKKAFSLDNHDDNKLLDVTKHENIGIKIIRFSDWVNDRVNFEFSSGKKIRCKIKTFPESLLVSSCIESVSDINDRRQCKSLNSIQRRMLDTVLNPSNSIKKSLQNVNLIPTSKFDIEFYFLQSLIVGWIEKLKEKMLTNNSQNIDHRSPQIRLNAKSGDYNQNDFDNNGNDLNKIDDNIGNSSDCRKETGEDESKYPAWHSLTQLKSFRLFSTSSDPSLVPTFYNCLPEDSKISVHNQYDEIPTDLINEHSLYNILECFHSVYEDLKLDTTRINDVYTIVPLLFNLSDFLNQVNYCDHYLRDFPQLVQAGYRFSQMKFFSAKKFSSVPDILHYLYFITCNGKFSFKTMNQSLEKFQNHPRLPALLQSSEVGFDLSVGWSRRVLKFFELLFSNKGNGLPERKKKRTNVKNGGNGPKLDGYHFGAKNCYKVLKSMVDLKFGQSSVDNLPAGVSIPLRYVLHFCQEFPPHNFHSASYYLIGREDIAMISQSNSPPSSNLHEDNVEDLDCNVDDENQHLFFSSPYSQPISSLSFIETFSYSNDENYSSTSFNSSVDYGNKKENLYDGNGMEHIFLYDDINLRFSKDLRLLEVLKLLNSSEPVTIKSSKNFDSNDPDFSTNQQLILLKLAQRTSSLSFGRAPFTLNTSKFSMFDSINIPKLTYTGKLPSQKNALINLDSSTMNYQELFNWSNFHNGVASGLSIFTENMKIPRTWIVYNKPSSSYSSPAIFSHGGLLLSLGLLNHLSVLKLPDIYDFLIVQHDSIAIGLLLGLSLSKRGTMDSVLSKTIYLHIPAKHPCTYPELEISNVIQTSALISIGILYEKSSHRLTTEILLKELEKKYGNENFSDIESYSLSAGFALGLVNLGKGNNTWGLLDLNIVQTLESLFSGSIIQKKTNFEIDSEFTNITSKENEQKNEHVLEGDISNIDLTAPGAILALGLIYFKTNNETVAKKLEIPNSHFAFEFIKPEFALLRILSKNIILWDKIEASDEWLESQIPGMIKKIMESSPFYFTPVNDSNSADVFESTESYDIDFDSILQTYFHILAGCCFSIGLKYAGSGNEDAKKLLESYSLFFLKKKRIASSLKSNFNENLENNFGFIDKNTVEKCLNVAILSLSLVMAGTGDLEVFKLFRFLYKRVDSDGSILYGNYMAISMAIGFLFLGCGRKSFRNDEVAVAYLIISLYPNFPTHPNDNRFHLQALRHLWVLAVENRFLNALEIDTCQPVISPIEIVLKNPDPNQEDTKLLMQSPCLIPSLSKIRSIKIHNPDYWPLDFQLPSKSSTSYIEKGLIFLKRKRNYFALKDKISTSDFNSSSLYNLEGTILNLDFNLNSLGSGNDFVLPFPSFESASETFSSQIFLQGSNERDPLLQVYYSLHEFIQNVLQNVKNVENKNDQRLLFSSIWGVKIALEFGRSNFIQNCPTSSPFFDFMFLEKHVNDFSKLSCETNPQSRNALSNYFNSLVPNDAASGTKSFMGEVSCNHAHLLALYLLWFGFPERSRLTEIVKFFKAKSIPESAVVPLLTCLWFSDSNEMEMVLELAGAIKQLIQ